MLPNSIHDAATYSRLQTAVVAAVIGVGMLALALWGHPPYWFFFLLKTYVVLGSLFIAYALWKAAPGTAPIGLLLVGIAVANALARMRRKEWFTFDLVASALFAAAIVIALRIINSKQAGKE
jgi:hypothetical protein